MTLYVGWKMGKIKVDVVNKYATLKISNESLDESMVELAWEKDDKRISEVLESIVASSL